MMTAIAPPQRNPDASTTHERDVEHQSLGEELSLQLLVFDNPDDPDHPHNWPFFSRLWATFILAAFNLVVTIASSIFGSAQTAIAREFGVSKEVTVLGTSLYLVVCEVDSNAPSQLDFSLSMLDSLN